MNWDVWGPPLVVVGVGAVLGAALAIASLARGRKARASEGEVLRARKEVLMEALHEVDADREKLGEEAWRSRREALVGEAADTLRALDQGEPAAPAEAEAPRKAPSSAASRAGWALGGVGFFVALGYLLSTFSAERKEGQPMTGGSSSAPQASDAEVLAARAALEKNPQDLDALNVLTWHAIRSRDLSGAMATLDKARAISPEDPYVLTHLAVLQLQIGMNDRAEATLLKALEKNPALPRALIFLGLARMQRDDREGAMAALEQAVAASPPTSEDRQMAVTLLAEAKAPPPQVRLQGSVALAEGLQTPTSGLLFIIARRSAEGGGPPVAALRVPLKSFPYSFSMADGDMMLGGEWPEQVWLQARVDSDGNPSTKSEGDVESAVIGPLSSGTKDIALTLGGS